MANEQDENEFPVAPSIDFVPDQTDHPDVKPEDMAEESK